MGLIYSIDEAFEKRVLVGASCAFGVFDGVHKGHQFLIDSACEMTRENGGASVALTFDIDPDEVFRPDKLKKLMTNEERIQALSRTCADYVVVLPFTREFASQLPMDFLATTFGEEIIYSLHVGNDFRFGCKAQGTVADLKAWGDGLGVRICDHDLKSKYGSPITATRIRGLLSCGDCEVATKLLGHPYTFTGKVLEGRHEGADMGFATANLELPAMLQVLGEGVYAAYGYVDGRKYKVAMSIGVAPTFEDATATCEAHILDFEGDIYGDTITIEPVHYLRPMIKFESTDELIATVMDNIAWTRENL